MNNGTLTPAYGRDYKSVKALKADWEAGKDFVYNCGASSTYCSKRDFPKGTKLPARYNRITRIAMLTA